MNTIHYSGGRPFKEGFTCDLCGQVDPDEHAPQRHHYEIGFITGWLDTGYMDTWQHCVPVASWIARDPVAEQEEMAMHILVQG